MTSIDPVLSTGLPGLDRVIRGLMPGDNFVWHVDSVDDYQPFVDNAKAHACRVHQTTVYFRFATHKPLIEPADNVVVCKLHPDRGFHTFIREIHEVIDRSRHKALYVFDCLSELAANWSSDRMVGNFFMLTCPRLYDVGATAYFSLLRDKHSFHATGPISDTTQVLIEVYRRDGKTYVHPVKVQHRNSPTMYMLHAWEGDDFVPVTQSATTARILSGHAWNRLDIANYQLGFWSSTFIRAEAIEAAIDQGGPPPADFDEFVDHLRRMMITEDPRMLEMARRYLSLEDILGIRRRMIGTGLIGGKSTGMLLARAILRKADPSWGDVLEPHDSFFIGADVFCSYLVQNGCWWGKQTQRGSEVHFDGAIHMRQQMLTGTFPEYVLKQFAAMLDYFGSSPIIVRSSSILEDAFGNAFAGKYESVFCANQGSPDKRMTDFLSAVRVVYASVMSDDALTYRAARGLLDRDEQMALLVQRVSGVGYGRRFFPQAAGVSLSFNPYVWDERIDPAAGVTRIVFGLGTRAVDRRDDDYTRIVALNEPLRRPETDAESVRQHAQQKVDCLDLEANQELTETFETIAGGSPGLPLEMFAARDRELEQYARERKLKDVFPWVLTFETLLTRTEFVEKMRNMLRLLHEAYGQAVDVEYTLNFFEEDRFKINLVQCRPLQVSGDLAGSDPPADISGKTVVIETSGPVVGHSHASQIDRVIMVSQSVYGNLPTYDRYAVARAIGKLNRLDDVEDLTTLLVGPGRWGSSMPTLGVPVQFAEIRNVAIICEIVAMRDGLVPDVSLGTHFFNELVEMDMLYIAILPERDTFVPSSLENAPNRLGDLLPAEKTWENVIRVVDVADTGRGNLVLNANVLTNRVLCYFE